MFAIFAVAELSVRSVLVMYEAMECVITVNSGDGIRQWRREEGGARCCGRFEVDFMSIFSTSG